MARLLLVLIIKWPPISLTTMPKQTKHVEGVIQPIIKVWIKIWADLKEARLRGETLLKHLKEGTNQLSAHAQRV